MGRLPRRTSAHIPSGPPRDIGVVLGSRAAPRRPRRFQDMGRSPRRTSARIPSSPPRDIGVVPGSQAACSHLLQNQDMGRSPRRTSAHTSSRDPQNFTHVPEDQTSMVSDIAGPGSPQPVISPDPRPSRCLSNKSDEEIPESVYVIHGGQAAGGVVSSSRETYAAELLKPLTPRKRSRPSDDQIISFSEEDLEYDEAPHNDPLVISALVNHHPLDRILMDSGSASNFLSLTALRTLGKTERDLVPSASPIMDFVGRLIYPLGVITLPVSLGTGWKTLEFSATFNILSTMEPYHAIVGRTSINAHGIVTSSFHRMAKFPTPHGIGQVTGNSRNSQTYHVQAVTVGEPPALDEDEPVITEEDPRENKARPAPVEDLKEVELDGPEKLVRIGTKLPAEVEKGLIDLLRKYKELFAWSPSDMPGISTDVISHELKIDPSIRPIAQKRRPMGPEKKIAIRQEVGKLLEAGFIKEIRFQTWVANPVLVKKPNGKWRVCIDFRDLNKACPKDAYPLPRIDQLVDATAGHELMSFMDAYSGYNQIKMSPEDAPHTAFYADSDIYYYLVMPFGLINAGATYQRMVNQLFGDMIGDTMEAYVDDMLVKSKKAADHPSNLERTFQRMRQHQVRLNPAKCAFGVYSGKFLGFMVSQRGIEVNPEKLQAIEDMRSPTSHKEVQSLNGRLAALGRFLAKSADKSLPFFEVLRANKKFEWTPACEEAFQDLKRYLKTLPPLAKPNPGDKLLMYLAVTEAAISSVLVKEEEDRTQRPVYFISKVLSPCEKNYALVEKHMYALVHSARKLRPYFHAHEVTVLTSQPLKQFLQRPDVSGRMIKWAVELTEFRIHIAPRTAIKGQALADFIVESTGPAVTEPASAEKDTSPEEKANIPKDQIWEMYTDGASNQRGAGAGLILVPPDGGPPLRYALALTFEATNNEAEYEALVTGLRIARGVGVEHLRVKCDTRLVVNQINGQYAALKPSMKTYLREVRSLIEKFKTFDIEAVPRDQNQHADALSRFALGAPLRSLEISPESSIHYVERILVPLYEQLEALSIEDAPEEENWMTPFLRYLEKEELPAEEVEAARVRRLAINYLIINGSLYKRGYSTPYLRCVTHPETAEILQDLHEGDMACHEGAKSLIRKILALGYYWPTMRKEAIALVQTCESCQLYTRRIAAPAAPLTSIPSAWPFALWGIDIIGPFPRAQGGKTHVVVAIDYFTKWIEAKALSKTTELHMVKFVRSHVVSRFGIPKAIISDNGPQFTGQRFNAFCEDLRIEHHYSSVKHAQSNGQVEAANKVLLNGLKKRLHYHKSSWLEELDHVLWATRTTPKTATGESPFSLVYGSEAVAPIEVVIPTHRTLHHDPETNEEARRLDLDLVEERRWDAQRRQAQLHLATARYYNRRVRRRQFRLGEWVLRRNEFSGQAQNKLTPPWEGPYKIVGIPHINAYRLEDTNGRLLANTFSGEHLKKFYL